MSPFRSLYKVVQNGTHGWWHTPLRWRDGQRSSGRAASVRCLSRLPEPQSDARVHREANGHVLLSTVPARLEGRERATCARHPFIAVIE
jgi:hypothetical protein